MRKLLVSALGLGIVLLPGIFTAPAKAQSFEPPYTYSGSTYLAAPGLEVPRGYPGGYVAAPVPSASTYLAAPGLEVPRSVYGDRGDPLHRYYTPGLAPNVGNPSVSPSYQNPAVDSGLLFPGTGRN